MLLALLSFLAPVSSADRFVVIPFAEIAWEGAPPATGDEPPRSMSWDRGLCFGGYVVLDGGGEGYLDYGAADPWSFEPRQPLRCALHTTGAATGRIFLAKPDYSGFEAHRFKIPDTPGDAAAKDAFHAVMESSYGRLLGRNLPGGAWFRHQIAAARAARGLGADASGDANGGAFPWRGGESGFDETFELFTGDRALAENLDLERALRGLASEAATIDVDSIEGVTTRAMDWKALVAGLHPGLDPLASLVPADQHAVFFPTFEAMTRVFDEVDESGTPVLQFASARTEDQRTKERYQEQLCLPLSAVTRLLGPAVVASVAITGSDPYLPSGTDLAILFECKDPGTLEKTVMVRHLEAKSKGAEVVEGTAGAIRYGGVRTPDRSVSSYLARLGNTILVTNSTAQLERIAAAAEGRAQPLAKADEYVWFRERYPRGDPAESALLVLTDATIRRWASPRSRIADSRRVRALAAMTEVHARNLHAIASGKAPEGPAAQPDLPFSSDFAWDRGRVRSKTYGTPGFLTPVAELEVAKVTPSEKAAYERFRAGFQSRWRNVFDPIALRLSFSDKKLAADLTVMPLVVDSDYRELRDLTLDAALTPAAGDAHEGTLLHFAFAFGKRSDLARMLAQGLGPFAQQLGADPLGWVGGGVAIYADRDAFWDELLRAPDRSAFLEKGFYRMPIALHVEVKDPLKLAAFLLAVRAMGDGAAPGMARWETKTWHEQSYVAIHAEESAGLGEEMANAAVYYAAMPNAFVLSLREDVVQRAIDRRIARKAATGEAPGERPWLGASLGLRAERDAVDVISGLAGEAPTDEMQRAAWSALPILGEWHRLFPAEDPLAVHERLFGVRLTTPAGGSFVWNEAMQSMEATDYGSPAVPKTGPSFPAALARFQRGEFGLSFEGEGLRVRAELERDGK